MKKIQPTCKGTSAEQRLEAGFRDQLTSPQSLRTRSYEGSFSPEPGCLLVRQAFLLSLHNYLGISRVPQVSL